MNTFAAPLVNVTIPVFNEERRLLCCVPRLHEFLSAEVRFEFEVVIANNGSTDRTQAVAERLSQQYQRVRSLWIPQRGRGGAIRLAWQESAANILSYMDVDLSTGLAAFPAMVEAVLQGGFELAVGSRLMPGAETKRRWRRELISRGYMGLIAACFHVRFSDAQCGFKAIARQSAHELLPQVEDNGWFFDTELLVLAEKLGYRICDLPVAWIEDPDSRVKVAKTAWADLQGVARLWWKLRRGGVTRLRPDLKVPDRKQGFSP